MKYRHYCRLKDPDCPKCNVKGDIISKEYNESCELTEEPIKRLGISLVTIVPRFNSLSSSEKKKILKKRSHEDSVKRGIVEKKHEMNKDFKRDTRELREKFKIKKKNEK